MRGQHAAVTVQQCKRGIAHLAFCRPSGHLQMGLDQMRNGAADTAMAVAQKSAMGVEWHVAIPTEMTGPDECGRLARLGQSQLFQKHRQRDG